MRVLQFVLCVLGHRRTKSRCPKKRSRISFSRWLPQRDPERRCSLPRCSSCVCTSPFKFLSAVKPDIVTPMVIFIPRCPLSPLLSPRCDSRNSSTPAQKPTVVFAFAVVLHLHGADVGVHVSKVQADFGGWGKCETPEFLTLFFVRRLSQGGWGVHGVTLHDATGCPPLAVVGKATLFDALYIRKMEMWCGDDLFSGRVFVWTRTTYFFS